MINFALVMRKRFIITMHAAPAVMCKLLAIAVNMLPVANHAVTLLFFLCLGSLRRLAQAAFKFCRQVRLALLGLHLRLLQLRRQLVLLLLPALGATPFALEPVMINVDDHEQEENYRE